ncbi:MAG: hypothetical protein K940chlam9_00140 [Chlamydiae bacterium]|nr:hypothetical protein [Chlamydiota bacterium]
MKRYISRTLESILKKAVKEFPAVVLTGPRQAGKTTILKHFFSGSHRYISLEPPDVRSSALADPRGFLELYEPPLILDEIQYVPELLFYIKEKIDQNRDRYGQYVLTGSQNLLLLQQVTESLAGRAAMLRLLPLSYPEINGKPEQSFPWEREKRISSTLSIRDFWPLMLRGSYPELHEHPEKDSALWQGSYLQTYLERDIRSLRQIGDLTQFQLFLRSVAIRSGQLFRISEVAKEIGLSVNTIKAWLGVLEASYQVVILRPYFVNRGKRLVKTPKVYFLDVGILCYLLGLQEVESLYRGAMAGPIVETFLFSEIYKRLSSRGGHPELYFWRTSTGQEVDLLIEERGKLIPIEVKASSTPKPQMAKGILTFQKDFPKEVEKGYVIHLGEQVLPLAPNVEALPFAQL